MRRLALLGGGCSLGIFLAQYLLPPALCLPGAGLCLALTALAVFLLRRTDLPRRRALLLGCALIGEVQASVWDAATREACAKAGIPLL